MPTEAFLNLEEHKKIGLLESAIHEFSVQPYEKVSIHKIAQAAGVSRSGFYYYFNDKEDIYKYLVEQVRDELVKSLKDDMKKYDIFTLAHLIFQRLVKLKGSSRERFIRQVVQNLRTEDTKEYFAQLECYEKAEDFHYLRDLESLKISSSEELVGLVSLIISSTLYSLIQYFEDKTTLAEAENRLRQMFDIIKYGVLK